MFYRDLVKTTVLSVYTMGKIEFNGVLRDYSSAGNSRAHMGDVDDKRGSEGGKLTV